MERTEKYLAQCYDTLPTGEIVACMKDADGFKYYFDRDNAITRRDGTRQYYWQNPAGFMDFHREDGPAIEFANGTVQWYYRGIIYYFDEWLKLIPSTEEEKLMLKLTWG